MAELPPPVARGNIGSIAAPALDQLAREEVAVDGHPPASPGEVHHDEWKKGFDNLLALARSRADRYPPGFEADISRDGMHKGCVE